MSRLIDADALMPNADYKGKYDVVTAYDIANAPTIDAVKVVRCKDCKYHELYEEHHTCEWHGFADVKPDWYCADGERKEDE